MPRTQHIQESSSLETVTRTGRLLRNLVARDPKFLGDDAEVVNIDHERRDELKQMVLLDLADGTTVRLDITRYTRT